MGISEFASSRYSFSELCRWCGKPEGWISEVADEAVRRGCPLREEWQREAVEFTRRAYGEIGPVTVRQVHYYLVSRNIRGYSNTLRDYERLVEFMLRARIAGVIPWRMVSEEESLAYTPRVVGAETVEEAVSKARIPPVGRDPWGEVGKRAVVFTEKRELFSQLLPVCRRFYVPLVSFKGYGSVWTRLSKMSGRMRRWLEEGSRVYVLVVSDHDPSGLDINRFYLSVLRNYFKIDFEDIRVALTAEQIVRFSLPPNPAKEADPRFKWYRRVFGEESWEVDALVAAGITYLRDELERAIVGVIGGDMARFERVVEENRRIAEEARRRLNKGAPAG